MIYLDFETRSEADLKKVGAWKYSQDPTTEVLCMAYHDTDWKTNSINHILFWSPEPNWEEECVWWKEWIPSIPSFESHNVGFEYAIWHNIMVSRYGWPEVPIYQWSCSAAKVAMHGLPRSLEGATKALGLRQQKDIAGHKLMLKLCKPRPHWVKTGKGDKYFGTSKEFKQLSEYCKQDVRAEMELSQALSNLPPLERKIWIFDQKVNQRGIACDVALAKIAIEIARKETTRASKLLIELTDGQVTTPNQVTRILSWCNDNGFPIPNLAKETIATYIDQTEGKIHEVLSIRQKFSRSSVRKYQAILDRVCDDGRIRDNLIYHGAHTGRWTGSGVQGQNLFRPVFDRILIETVGIPLILTQDLNLIKILFGDVMALLSSAIRSTLCAKQGHDLIGADYSSIEARILLWSAREQKALDLIKAGRCIYRDMAAAIYGKKYEEVTKKERQLGKIAILGLGYGMGASKFQATCANWGIEISLEFADRIVKLYRQKYKKVVRYWWRLEKAALEAMHSGSCESWTKENQFLSYQLPSGRFLWYPFPEVRVGRFDNPSLTYKTIGLNKKWVRTETYGGKLVENDIQAKARDIMAWGMLQAEDNGYPIVLSVHDEAVTEVPKEFGSIDEFERLLCHLPDWAQGCPIEAEGWRGERYRK